MARDPDALRTGERIQVHLDIWIVETEGQAQSRADEAEEGWEWKGEEGHEQVEDKMVLQETLAHKEPAQVFGPEKGRPRQSAREPWEDEEVYELAAGGVGIQGSGGVGRMQEDGKEGAGNNFGRTVAESWGRKELKTEYGQEEGRDSKDPGGEQRYTRSHSDKQDNTCKE